MKSNNHNFNATKKRLSKKRLSKKRLSKKRLSKKRLSKKRLSKKRLSKKRLSKKRLSKKRLSKKRLSKRTQKGGSGSGSGKRHKTNEDMNSGKKLDAPPLDFFEQLDAELPTELVEKVNKKITAYDLKQWMLTSTTNMNYVLKNLNILTRLENSKQIYSLLYKKLLFMLHLEVESSPFDVFYPNKISEHLLKNEKYTRIVALLKTIDPEKTFTQNNKIINDILYQFTQDQRYYLFVYAANVSLMDEGTLVIPDGTTVIPDFEPYDDEKEPEENYTFKKRIIKVIIPDSVTIIDFLAFEGCSNLFSVVIPDSVITIATGAFVGCLNLETVVIGDNVESIGNNAFYSCSSLKKVIIPDSVTTIGYDAFSSCSSLTSVVIGNSVTTIGFKAFGYCSNLASVTFKALNNVPQAATSLTLGDDVWMRTPLEDIIPDDGSIIHEARNGTEDIQYKHLLINNL